MTETSYNQLLIDAAIYLLTINLCTLKSVEMSLYDSLALLLVIVFLLVLLQECAFKSVLTKRIPGTECELCILSGHTCRVWGDTFHCLIQCTFIYNVYRKPEGILPD